MNCFLRLPFSFFLWHQQSTKNLNRKEAGERGRGIKRELERIRMKVREKDRETERMKEREREWKTDEKKDLLIVFKKT